MAQQFVLKVPRYTADQLQIGKPPYPAGVDDCQFGDGSYHWHAGPTTIMPMQDHDWILTETVTGVAMVVADETFKSDYAVAIGPG